MEWVPEGETLVVKLTANNGLGRIAGGEPVDEVIAGGWAMSADRAANVTALLAVDDAGEVVYERLVLGIAETESEIVTKNTITRVWFQLAPAPQLSHLHGQPSPALKSRNAIGYVPTRTLVFGDSPVETVDAGSRAVVQGFTLTVAEDGSAHLVIPAGARIMISTAA